MRLLTERLDGTAAAELEESAAAAELEGEGTAARLIGTAAAELNKSPDAVSEGSVDAAQLEDKETAVGELEGR